MENKDYTAIQQLKVIMTKKNWDSMIKQAQDGDKEWATDMAEEVLEGITTNSVFWAEGYHDTMGQLPKEVLKEFIIEWHKWPFLNN